MRFLLWLLATIVTSCYFFPFSLSILPFANSKMILAAIGLVILGVRIALRKDSMVDKRLVVLTIWAFAVSIIAFAAAVYNNTNDYTYATYFMSMWVWLGGAYTTLWIMKLVHGKVTVPIVVNYLLAVCVLQCILALWFDHSASAENWYQGKFSGDGFMAGVEDRLHGIGCALDVAGFRMAAVITLTSYILVEANREGKSWLVLLYFLAIGFVFVVGNMIARSTMVGLAVGGVYVVYSFLFRQDGKGISLLGKALAVLIVAIPFTVYLYNTNSGFHDNLRFGFEGFFNWYETGEWSTNSNNILKNMVVWPESTKTWLIGDGYLNNPLDEGLDSYDPFYSGPSFKGFYMGTDIGYCRFLFYFGIFGLLLFMSYFVVATVDLMQRFPKYRVMFLLLLALNFIEWVKVATDLFVVFAPFLCLDNMEQDRTEDNTSSKTTIPASVLKT